MKYKEGFSRRLVEQLVEEFQPTAILDPFSGIGTTPLIAASKGLCATGIEIMPVGVMVGNAIMHAANGLSRSGLEDTARELLEAVRSSQEAPTAYAFPHVRITEAAFPEATEKAIAKARQFIDTVTDVCVRTLLDVACMTVLEDISYTRKDGQYLRWDHRSARPLRSRVNKGHIPTFHHALGARLFEMVQDIHPLKMEYGGGSPELVTGSSLELLRELPTGCFDMVITSPPYANRYDYTRTYALELAWLGYRQRDFTALRQKMLSATVENRSKHQWLRDTYRDDPTVLHAATGHVRRTGRRP